jgi:NADH dehydrogenase
MIMVAGGTGRLGTALVGRLTGRGERVRVLTRERQRAAHLAGPLVEVVCGDLTAPGTAQRAVEGADQVVSAVHGLVGPRGVSPATIDRDGNASLVDASATAGAEVVLMSVVGAAADSAMELCRMKHAAEAHLRDVGLPATVVRATPFAELWIDLLRHTARHSGRPVVFGNGHNPISFVSVRDVAAAVDAVLQDHTARGAILEITGPESLTFNELVALIQSADGRKTQARHLPPALLGMLAGTIGWIRPSFGRQLRSAMFMDRTDLAHVSDDIKQRYPDLPRTTVLDLLVC